MLVLEQEQFPAVCHGDEAITDRARGLLRGGMGAGARHPLGGSERLNQPGQEQHQGRE